MKFDELVNGQSVFLDANVLIYYFAIHPSFGPPCDHLVARIENQELIGITSTSVLSEVAHHLMTFEAAVVFNWQSKVMQRLKRDPSCVKKLTKFREGIEKVPQLGIQVLAIPASLIASAASISQQTGLLSNDALIVAVMQANKVTNLASHDGDFDRVPGITRYSPA